MQPRTPLPPAASADASADSIPVTALKGVGPRIAARLERLGIRTVQDLLFHLPLRYEDRTRVVALGSLRPGDQAVVEGTVELAEIGYGRRRSLLCRLSDGTGAITLRFFHFSAAQKAMLARGVRLRCFGEARPGKVTLEMVHPEYSRVDEQAPGPAQTHLTPIYPATEGVHQLKLRALADQAIAWLERNPRGVRDWLPAVVRAQFRLPILTDALHYVHRPPPQASVEQLSAGRHPAQQRLAFEELLAHQLSLRRLRAQTQHFAASAVPGDSRWLQQFIETLPFSLTDAQRRVINEIRADVARPFPMLRLVQGDVGSGKTVVAAAVALTVMEAGFQAALMAPTELLAEQHFNNFQRWLAPLGVEVEWLSGRLKGRTRERVVHRIADGSVPMVVGTHALFQEGVEFDHLALVVVDEQHRFGVHQRLALREKGSRDGRRPHQLIMTATPIPRTLAMAAYADLDTSVIDELPPGRTPVVTVVVPDSRRSEVVERVRSACRQGRQAYWVCTLIEESESLQCQAAADTAAQLGEALPELRVGLLHGRMKPAEKESVMTAFKDAHIDLLVATTVIEVGVDVPNAGLMVVENAERFGLAQLHQLRGRVGRGSVESNCVLMYHGPLSRAARARLAVLRDTNDGFRIAHRDLELRGPGEVLGTRQTGMLQLQIADLLRDRELLPAVQRAADVILRDLPDHIAPLIRRWMGEAVRYGGV